MPSKHYQSIVRLLSIATVSTGMLLARANLVMPALSAVWAAEPSTTTETAHADSSSIPESNPYADLTQCTAGAWDSAAKAGHKLPWFPGNATDWDDGAKEHGYTVKEKLGPDVVGTVAVWEAGVGGTGYAGHVGYVVEVKGDQFRVQERNWIPAADGERWVTWEEGISFIVLEEPEKAAPADAAPADAPPAQDSAPAQGGSTPDAAPAQPEAPQDPAQPEVAATSDPTVDAAPDPQPAEPIQPLLRQFVVEPWQPNRPSPEALNSPLQTLVNVDLWAPHFGATLSQCLGLAGLGFGL